MSDHPVPGSSSKDGKQNKAGDKHLKSIASNSSALKTPMIGNSGGPVDSGSSFGSSKATHSLQLKSNAKIDEDYNPTRNTNRKKNEFTTEVYSTTSITPGGAKVKIAGSSSSTKSNAKNNPLSQYANPPTIKVNSESVVDLNTNRPVVEDPLFLTDGGDGNYVFKFTGFDSAEIKALGKRFRKLDKNSDGMITQEEFMSIPDLQSNPIVSRVIDIFDTDNTGSVNFREFVHGMSLFSENSKKQRIGILRFAFRIYDMDNDGYISNGELFQVLKLMVGDNLTDIELQQIVDKTIIYADKDKDNKISLQEFINSIGGFGYEQKMVLMNL